ncbi:MAG: hypothetical protein ACR2RA_21700 [Geminicoccaceae bacterium]
MSIRAIAIAALVAAAPALATAPSALAGNKIELKTPGAVIDALGGNKRLQAGDAKIKIKPGKRGDCVRIAAGNAKVAKGKIKDGKCKS